MVIKYGEATLMRKLKKYCKNGRDGTKMAIRYKIKSTTKLSN